MAGNLSKSITGMRIDSAAAKAVAQYGYDARSQKHRGLGPGSHYVYPELFGTDSNNGLSRGAGFSVGAGATVNSAYFDLSGWARWAVYMNFPVGPVVGGVFGTFIYLDPAFNNLFGTPSAFGVGAGVTSFFADTQTGASGAVTQATPYLKFYYINSDAVPRLITASLFCYDYLVR